MVGRLLDEYQSAFCDDEHRNLRLLAPAGSGKTHSLLYRCADIFARQKGSARFLLVTFTRAARDELRARLGRPEFKDAAGSIEVTTLNGWGWRRVRGAFSSPRLMVTSYERSLLGKNILLPVIEQHAWVKDALSSTKGTAADMLIEATDLMKSLGFDHDRDRSRDAFNHHLAWLRSVGCQPMVDQLGHLLKRMRIVETPSDDQIFDRFVAFWTEAVSLQFSQSVFTMEDQKYGAARVIEASMERGQAPQGGSRYTDVLVDEFQDINPLDFRMIKGVIDYHRASLTIVGDDDQTIYEWRGATPEFILNPEDTFGRPFRTHILQNNYRCPRNIVEHSKMLIAHNHRRVAKQINARSKEEAEVRIVRNPDFSGTIEEITALAQDFLEHDARSGKRLALIARKRAQLIPYQIVFASLDIPFCAAEDLQVFLNDAFKQLRDIVDIRAAAQGQQRTRDMIGSAMLLLDKIKRYPLSKQEKGKIEAYLSRERPKDWEGLLTALASYDGPIKKTTGPQASALLSVFCDSIRRFLRSETVARTLDCVSTDFAGFDKDYGKSKEELFYADPPFFYLTRFSEKYGSDFDAFLEDVDRAIETLVQLPGDEDGADDLWARPIHLMTALRAKGREFAHVVLLDVNDGIWPARQAETAEQYEQERRVFYVAMTRAKECLWLTVSGSMEGETTAASRYIEEAGFEGAPVIPLVAKEYSV